jgi:GT2 family glycosyltransferase
MPPGLVTVVIPAYNRGESLRLTLESLARQRYPDLEVLVVDDGSTNAAAGMREPAGNVRVIRNSERRGPAYARNLALLHARGVYVWFLDSDVLLPDPATLERMVEALSRNPAIGSLGGEIVSTELPHDRAYGRRIRWNARNRRVVSRPGDSAWTECDYLATCNCITKKDDLFRIGGFDEQFVFGAEDMDLGYRLQRLGLKNYVSHSFAVIHCQDTAGRYHDETDRYQKTRIQFARLHFGRPLLWAMFVWELAAFLAFYLLLVPKLCYRFLRRQAVTQQNLAGGWNRLHSFFTAPRRAPVSMLASRTDRT